MARLVAVPKPPAPTLSATSVSSSEIDLNALYMGAGTFASYQFYVGLSSGGPFNPLSAFQSSGLFQHTGLSPGQTFYYFAVAKLSTGAVSVASPVASATTVSIVSVVKKFVSPLPVIGNFGLLSPQLAGASNFSARKAIYDADPSVSALSGLSGYIVQDTIIGFEPGPNPGLINGTGYQFPYAADIQELANLPGSPRGFGFKISTYINNGTIVVPDYWYNTGNSNYTSAFNGGFYGTSSSYMIRARLDSMALCQRIVQLHTVIAQVIPITVNGVTYIGADNCPNVLVVVVDEETQASSLAQATYNVPNQTALNLWDQNLITYLFLQLRAIWKKTVVLFPFNWINTAGNVATQLSIANAYANAIAGPSGTSLPGVFGGPDTLPRQTWQPGGSGNPTYIGTAGNAAYTGQLPGGTDYRPLVPCIMQAQFPDLPSGGSQASTPQQVINFAYGNSGTNLDAAALAWQVETGATIGSPPGTGANWRGDIQLAFSTFTPKPNAGPFSNFPNA